MTAVATDVSPALHAEALLAAATERAFADSGHAPAHIPGPDDQLDDLPDEGQTIRAALLDAFDRQRQVDLASRIVARHFQRRESAQALIETLAEAVLREDAAFQPYQMLEAGLCDVGCKRSPIWCTAEATLPRKMAFISQRAAARIHWSHR